MFNSIIKQTYLGVIALLILSVPGLVVADESISLQADDFVTRNLGYEKQGEASLLIVEAVPRHEKTRQALGYSKVRAWYDTRKGVYRKALFWDETGVKTRTVFFKNLQRKAGRYTPSRIEIVDHQSGQTMVFDTGSDKTLSGPDQLVTQGSQLFPGFY